MMYPPFARCAGTFPHKGGRRKNKYSASPLVGEAVRDAYATRTEGGAMHA